MDSRYLQDKDHLKQSAQGIDEERRSFLTAGLIGGAVAASTLAAGECASCQTLADLISTALPGPPALKFSEPPPWAKYI